MWTQQKLNNNSVRKGCYLSIILLIGYFSYHSYCGSFGLHSYSVEEYTMRHLQLELDTLVYKRVLLEKRAQLLHADSPDLDTLDEYARKTMNLAKKNEYVILLTRGDLTS